MAVVDTYVNSEVDAVTGTFTGNAIQAQGSGIKVVTATFIPASGDDDGSVYRLFKDIPSNVVPLRLDVMTDGVTGMDDVDFGIYKTDKGDVVDKDILGDGLDLSSAAEYNAPLNGMNAVSKADFGKKNLWELLGLTMKARQTGYDICATGNTNGSEADEVCVAFYYFTP